MFRIFSASTHNTCSARPNVYLTKEVNTLLYSISMIVNFRRYLKRHYNPCFSPSEIRTVVPTVNGIMYKKYIILTSVEKLQNFFIEENPFFFTAAAASVYRITIFSSIYQHATQKVHGQRAKFPENKFRIKKFCVSKSNMK